jgi:hypothetical protein
MSLKIDKWRAEGAEGTHYAHNTGKKNNRKEEEEKTKQKKIR